MHWLFDVLIVETTELCNVFNCNVVVVNGASAASAVVIGG